MAGRGDEDDRHGLLGADEEQIGKDLGHRLSRGSGPDQQPHRDAEQSAGGLGRDCAFVIGPGAPEIKVTSMLRQERAAASGVAPCSDKS